MGIGVKDPIRLFQLEEAWETLHLALPSEDKKRTRRKVEPRQSETEAKTHFCFSGISKLVVFTLILRRDQLMSDVIKIRH